MKIARYLAAGAVAAATLAAPMASAQSCTQGPISNTCINRGVPHDDRRVNGTGWVVCESYSGAPYAVQFDKYDNVQGFVFYICTKFHSCPYLKVRDPDAFKDFC
jgi:hypothetical protein